MRRDGEAHRVLLDGEPHRVHQDEKPHRVRHPVLGDLLVRQPACDRRCQPVAGLLSASGEEPVQDDESVVRA